MKLNKSVVLDRMKEKNITTQSDLALRLGMSKSQLSIMLSDDYNPIKTNVNKLMEILEVSFDDLTNEREEIEMQQMQLFDTGIDRNNYKLTEYTDIDNVIPNRKYNVFETFAGAGGLALGLELSGMNTIGAIEFDKQAVQTLKTNRPNWKVIEDDINQFVSEEKYVFLKNNIDILSGGYPCQSFSYAGKRAGLEDARGTLFYPFAKLVQELKPKVFLAENVKGLVNHDDGNTLTTMIEVFQEAGYKIYWNVLNAWDYDVAQKRERIFIVGIRNDLYERQTKPFRFPKPKQRRLVLRDILKNVPESPGVKYSEKKHKVLDMVPAGGSWVDLPEEVAKDYLGASWFSGGGKRGMARRLAWDEPSLTLTTSPSQKQTERCHPDETRPFTVREYARIQSFPDEWEFTGGVGSQYKQIGNAVPVNLAKSVGKAIIKYLNQF